MSDTRLLVCSDLHASEEALKALEKAARSEDFDAVVICGDFTTYGSLDYVRKALKIFETKVLAIPGNCDTRPTVDLLEAAGASIHGRRQELDGTAFFGFGGAVPSPHNMPFEVEEADIVAGLKGVCATQGVMVTHMPARGKNDLTRHGKHAGSEGIRRVAEECRPVLALSGHFHEARGVVEDGGTVFVNPGSARDGFYATVVLGRKVEAELKDLPGFEGAR
jgi:putative phosphoesterase